MSVRSGCAAIAAATSATNDASTTASRPWKRGYGWVANVTAMHTASTTNPNARHATASSGADPSPSSPRVIQLRRNHRLTAPIM